ncbi:MAG: glycosyltransferase family 39 protein [Parcubacteria group bacterium]|jgi:4-amino-4-deoxy-L-arabinose transferase-like glycosyltransferase
MKNILYNKIFWVVLLIVVVGAFLRTYHFADWMHYQLDQARDFRVVHAAMEYGPGELPLQGPRAAGSFLRLGPLMYYLEYGSALVFGDTPAGSVAIILILNILAIPLFYLFVRRFFDQGLSVGLTGIFSVSIFLITYSRFGWNPNLILPFTLLFAYALLRTSGQQNKNAGWWLVTASIALAFISSMHFVAFVTMPLIAIVYFTWARPWIAVRYWILAVAVFIFLNVPLIINDIKTGGDNFVAFIDVALNRSGGEDVEEGAEETSKSPHTLLDKVVYNIGQHTQFYWMIVTGDQLAAIPELDGSDLQCSYDCRYGLVRGVISFIMIFCAFGCWVFLYRAEEDRERKNFLRLILIWSAVLFLVYTPLAYDLAPRFFLLNAPLAFVIVGLLPKAISAEHQKSGQIFATILVMLCMGANLYFLAQYYHELARATTDASLVIAHHDRILKEKVRVTYAQMIEIVDWMETKYRANGEPLFVHAQPEYKRAFWERVDYRDIPRDHIPEDLKPLFRQGNYFIIIRAQSEQKDFLEKFLVGLDVVETKNFGTLTGYYLRAKPEFVTDEKKVFRENDRDPVFADGVQKRYLWRQIFEK